MATSHNTSHVLPPCSSLLLRAELLEIGSSWAAQWVEQQTSNGYVRFLLHSEWKEKGQRSTWVYSKLMVTSTMLHQIKKPNKPIYISKTTQNSTQWLRGLGHWEQANFLQLKVTGWSQVCPWCNSKSLQSAVETLALLLLDTVHSYDRTMAVSAATLIRFTNLLWGLLFSFSTWKERIHLFVLIIYCPNPKPVNL